MDSLSYLKTIVRNNHENARAKLGLVYGNVWAWEVKLWLR